MSKAEKTRQFIIEKTAPVFNKKGYAGTSLNDLTEITGLTKGSIYGNFENKDEVAVAVFKYNVGRLQDRFQSQIEVKNTFLEKLLVYPQTYTRFFDLMQTGGCPILNTATEADDTHELLKKMAANALVAWKKTIVGLIEQGIASGEFKSPDINPSRTALTIIATIEGAVMIAKTTGKMDDILDIMQSVEQMILNLR